MKLHLSPNPPQDCLLGQFNPIHSFITHIYRNQFNIDNRPIYFGIPSVLLPQGLPVNVPNHFLLPSLICQTQPSFSVFTLAITGKIYNFWNIFILNWTYWLYSCSECVSWNSRIKVRKNILFLMLMFFLKNLRTTFALQSSMQTTQSIRITVNTPSTNQPIKKSVSPCLFLPKMKKDMALKLRYKLQLWWKTVSSI